MRSKKTIILVVLGILLVGSGWKIYTLKCDWYKGVSVTRQASIDKGVYVATLKPTQNPLVVNDTIKVMIKDAWVERCWSYNCVNNVRLTNGDNGMKYQVTIVADPLGLKKSDFFYKWAIGIEANRMFRFSSDSTLLSFLPKKPKTGDILSYPIQWGTKYKPEQEKEIISKLNLLVLKSR